MQVERVEWKSGAVTRDIAADVAYKAILDIKKKSGGTLTDEGIVQAASAKRHVLHKLFEWDDTEAARMHRLTQARSLLRSFRVTYVERPETPVRAFQVQRKASPRVKADRTLYTTTSDAMSDGPTRERLIAEAIRQAMQFRRRFQELYELNAVFEAIDQTVGSLVSDVSS